jgi:succinate dehydrogenase/fumarate reductase flavoprotein subunit
MDTETTQIQTLEESIGALRNGRDALVALSAFGMMSLRGSTNASAKLLALSSSAWDMADDLFTACVRDIEEELPHGDTDAELVTWRVEFAVVIGEHASVFRDTKGDKLECDHLRVVRESEPVDGVGVTRTSTDWLPLADPAAAARAIAAFVATHTPVP